MAKRPPDLPPFTRRRIAALAEEALRDTGAVGVLPTPLDEVQKTLGILERLPMRQLPKAVAAKKPKAWKRILGAYWKEERVVFIDDEQSESRQQWTDGHEAAHVMCPWHAEILVLDNEDTLFRDLHDLVEAEANFGAGHLVFQGGRFHRRALRDQLSIRTPIEMAAQYGASRHAALHYYVEEHPLPVALLIAGRFPYADGSLPVWRSVESAMFRDRHGSLVSKLPGGRLMLGDGEDAPLAEIIERSRRQTDPPSKVVQIPDFGGRRRKFVAEAFFNGYCHFITVADQKSTRLGQRVRLAS
jgi:hypothetical protein